MAAKVVFEVLYKEYYVRVFGLCRMLLNSAPLAEDATQETFMRAYRHFDRYDTALPFWQWIASIANNYCVDQMRKKNHSEKLFGDEEVEFGQASSLDQHLLAALVDYEDAQALNNAIAQLPDKYRVPLVLAYFNDASYEQIAKDLAISRSHVGVLLLRAKQQLRSYIASAHDQDS